jgi:hypothetical protein
MLGYCSPPEQVKDNKTENYTKATYYMTYNVIRKIPVHCVTPSKIEADFALAGPKTTGGLSFPIKRDSSLRFLTSWALQGMLAILLGLEVVLPADFPGVKALPGP